MAVSVQPEAAGNVPPQNVEAEASVLGAILLTEQALDGVLLDVVLKPEDFYRPRHQLIFRSMIRLKEKAEPEAVDALTVCDDLKRSGELEEAGGESYVHSLPTLVPAAGNVRHYAKIVKDHAVLRRLLATAREIQDKAMTHAGDPRELLEQAEAALFKAGHEDGSGQLKAIEEVLHTELDKLERLSREGQSLTGTPSGFKDLDELTGGFQPGNLIVVAARPSMGKSSMVTNIAENASIDHGKAVALFSLEMSETELAQRFIASQSKIDGDALRKGRVKPDRWPKVLQATEKLAKAPLYVDDSSDIGILEIRAKARRLHARYPLGLLIVDYLQLMRAEDASASRVEQVGKMSRGLKILARELNIPVIGVSQLSRAVEARNPPIPMLSDLRESGCLTGDTRIYLPASGQYRPISELVGSSGFEVLAVNPETLKLDPRRVEKVFSTGRKRVHRLRTALGREIRATANHKFLTLDGWKPLDELSDATHIALPRELSGPSGPTMTDDELALLGHLIGDGCTLPRHAIQYTTNEPELAETVVELAGRVFGDELRPRIKRERRWLQVYLAAAGHLTHRRRNPVAAWLTRLGAFGYRAHEKRVPVEVFRQPADGIARFLRHLWSTDGCVFLARGRRAAPAIYYATSSPILARDVQSLLLRLGITAIRTRVGQAENRTQHHVKITGAPDVLRFLQRVGRFGARASETERRILDLLARTRPNTNRDVIPVSAWRTVVVPAMQAGGVTTRELQARIATSYCGSTLYKSGLSRERAARVADAVRSERLLALAASDVYWDRIISIEPAGVEDVYDLTVDGLHNFVAEDIVVHNSIEQDADLVLFLYRDEYYNRESERPGEADVIVAKHRNGPIGDLALTFLARYPKFANLYREPTLESQPGGNGRG